MARIRTIKPEFFTSEDIVEMEPLARLLYIALWCEADKEGRLPWKPKTFKMRYLPGDNCNIEEVCNMLIDSGLICLYADGLAYIPTFLRHQHINPRESASVLPAPEDCPPSTPKKITSTVRADVFERDGHACVRCGSRDKLTLDHILPQSLGGPHIQENLRCMCRSCNSGRPVSGQALRDDLATDGFTVEGLRIKFGIDASGRVATRAYQELTHREEGRKEGTGKEGMEGNLSEPSPDAPPVDPDSGPAGDPAPETAEKRARRRGSAEDEKCARWLYGQLLNILPSAKEPSWNGWSDDVRLMREIDKRSHHEICELFLWATKDSFWCRNILSPSKLREKWDQLTLGRQQARGGPGSAKPSAFTGLAQIDHSGTVKAMQDDMARRGSTARVDGNLEFD